VSEILPREKSLLYGIESLNNIELISLILKSGYKDKTVFDLAEDLINTAGEFNKLLSLSYDELVCIKGIKKAKALEIMAILEVCKRLSKVDSDKERTKLNPLVLVDYLRFSGGFKANEEFCVVFLNNAGKIIKSEVLFRGTYNMSVVDPSELFRRALLLKSHTIVIAHNHPSGDTKPSNADIELTNKIKNAGELLNVKLLDHIIISPESYYSFSEHNLLW